MDITDPVSLPAVQSWDRYWRGMQEGGQFGIGGASHPRLNEFWREFFAGVGPRSGPTKLIDIASGDGAVLATATDTLGEEAVRLTCVDVSRHAVELLQAQIPAAEGVVANALEIPLASESFDVVTSQYGLEYAGSAAFAEAARLVAPGGQLALLVHHRSSVMYRECSDSVDAVKGLKSSEFIARSIAMFEAGYAELQGGDRQAYDSAVHDLLPAFRELENIMQRYGSHVAGDTVLRLYQDVDNIHQQMERYDPTEILQWLSRMDSELDVYSQIMAAMCGAALSEPEFDAVCDTMKNTGLVVHQAVPVHADGLSAPLAWALIAERPAQ